MDQMNNEGKAYKDQQKIGILSFLAELPNFVLMLISAIMSHTLIVWMDLIDSFSNVMRSSVVTVSSIKLKKGTLNDAGKFEKRASLICEVSVDVGLFCVIGCSIYELINPHEPGGFLLYTLILKVINIAIDTYMVIKQYRIWKVQKTPIIAAEMSGFKKDLSFDTLAFVTMLVCYVLRKYEWSWYISPVLCLPLAVYFLVKSFMRIAKSLKKDK